MDALAKVAESRSASVVKIVAPDIKCLSQKDIGLHDGLQRLVEMGQRTTFQKHKKSIDNLVSDLQIRQTKSHARKIQGTRITP